MAGFFNEGLVGGAAEYSLNDDGTVNVIFPGQPDFPFPNCLIVILDEIDYQYPVVTDPLRSTLFVLNSKPQMDEGFYQSLLSELEAMGISIEFLIVIP